MGRLPEPGGRKEFIAFADCYFHYLQRVWRIRSKTWSRENGENVLGLG